MFRNINDTRQGIISDWKEAQLYTGVYTLIKLESSHNPSKVFSAQLDNGRELAVKTIGLHLDGSPETLGKLLNGRFGPLIPKDSTKLEESEFIRRFHPNIVKHFSAEYVPAKDLEEPFYAIRMEYLRGTTLRNIARARLHKLTEAELANVAKQILDGLAFLHDKHYVHRNLDGTHVFVTGNTEDLRAANTVIKIVGLGAAKQLESRETKMNQVSFVGRSASLHRSPEMVQGYFDLNITVGRKTDIWSLGVLLLDTALKGDIEFVRNFDDNRQKSVAKKTEYAINDLLLPDRDDVLKGYTPDYMALTEPEMARLRGFIARCLIRATEPEEDAHVRPRANKLLEDRDFIQYYAALRQPFIALDVASALEQDDGSPISLRVEDLNLDQMNPLLQGSGRYQ